MSLSRMLFRALALMVLSLLSACSALHTSVAKRELDVQTRLAETIYLTPVEPEQRSVYLDVRNSSGEPALDMRAPLVSALESRGYRLLDRPAEAQFWLQVNVRSVEKLSREQASRQLREVSREDSALPDEVPTSEEETPEEALHRHQHGAGHVYIAAHGGRRGGGGKIDSDDLKKAVALAVVWWAAESIGDALVDDVYYAAHTDVQIAERVEQGLVHEQSEHSLQQGTSGSTELDWENDTAMHKMRTVAISVANQVNLKKDEAVTAMREGLARALSGLF